MECFWCFKPVLQNNFVKQSKCKFSSYKTKKFISKFALISYKNPKLKSIKLKKLSKYCVERKHKSKQRDIDKGQGMDIKWNTFYDSAFDILNKSYSLYSR
jgi:hypothetical protein